MGGALGMANSVLNIACLWTEFYFDRIGRDSSGTVFRTSIQDLSIDEKAEILFLDQGITTAAVLAVLYTVASTSQPLPQDVYRCDLKDPFSLQKGWLLWAGIGLAGAIAAIAVTEAAASMFRGESPEREGRSS